MDFYAKSPLLYFRYSIFSQPQTAIVFNQQITNIMSNPYYQQDLLRPYNNESVGRTDVDVLTEIVIY